jgi:type VI secretion system secreted protein VgrG
VSDLEDIAVDQGARLISVESFDLGKKKLIITSFEGREELSALPIFRLEVVTLGRALTPDEVLGKKLSLAVRTRGTARKFNGIISRMRAMQSTIREHYLHYLELVPPAWLLSLNRRYSTFHDMKATEIVQKVLNDGGISSRNKSVGSQREYTVQYGESDFNFVARLLEEEGVFFRMDHADNNCAMVLGDGSADYARLDPATLKFNEHIVRWQAQYLVGNSAFRHSDWDFKAVDVIEGSANGLQQAQPPGLSERQVDEYPGGFGTTEEGRRLARVRMEEQEGQFVWIGGSSIHPSLFAGAKFKVKDTSVNLPASNSKTDNYVLLQVDHRAKDFSNMPFQGETSYSNDFICMPADFSFRPARLTPKPRMHGPQTAMVTDGPDDLGRVKVNFPWLPDEASCWTRVAQNWAYNQMGSQFLPRMDSEVVVDFVDGDPDRPLIVGMVYNGKNKLPFAVPSNKTQSGIRGANWGDSGVRDKSNELRFEDRSGSEEIYLHAQKDFRRVVVDSDTLTVEQGDRKVEIQQGNVTETLSMGDMKVNLKQGSVTETLDLGNHSTKLSLGNYEVKASAGASKIEAMQSITFKVGGNSVTIDQTGVQIKGLMVKIEGQVMLDLKGVMTTVNGNGMLTLKGAITMVN